MIATLISALIPLVIGMIWYNPKVTGNAWMKECGFTEEYLKQNFNPLKTFGLATLFAIMLAFFMNSVVIHQSGLGSLLADPTRLSPELKAKLESVMAGSKNLYRDFKHGAFHGVIAALFFALPIIGTSALFERRSAKYIFIHVGYWVITLALMGGVICQWGGVGV
jgi:Protein of unknown function (DUF1761)